MSINNSTLPKFSTSLFWLAVIGYGFLLLLNFLTGFGKDYLVYSTSALALLFFLFYKSRVLLKFSTNEDYLEFATGNFFSLDEMSIKSNLVRVIKTDIEEIEYKGFFLWKKLRFKMNTEGKRSYLSMPLRFVPASKVHYIVEDIIGAKESSLMVVVDESTKVELSPRIAA